VSAAATSNPMKSPPPHQNVGPIFRHWQIHSTNHQPPFNPYIMHTMVINMCTSSPSCCMPCSSAMVNITCMPIAKCCPNGHLTQEHARAYKTHFYSTQLTQHTQMMCLCSHVEEMAQGLHQHLCQDLCTYQILPAFKFTPSQPSGPTSSAPFPPKHTSPESN
jgi:hypothetical protein